MKQGKDDVNELKKYIVGRIHLFFEIKGREIQEQFHEVMQRRLEGLHQATIQYVETLFEEARE